MNVLIAYTTTEGQTRKIARYMARSNQNTGHVAELYDCSDASEDVNIADFDAVHLAEGAIRYYQHGSSEELTIDPLVFKGQKKLPERNGNPEYTDWQALDEFVASLLEKVAASSSTHSA